MGPRFGSHPGHHGSSGQLTWHCAFCKTPIPRDLPRGNRTCNSSVCKRKMREVWIARTRLSLERRARRCRFCDEPVVPGRKVCARHQWRRTPCPRSGKTGCTTRVPYHDGKGAQRIYCTPSCRRAAARDWAREASRGGGAPAIAADVGNEQPELVPNLGLLP